MSVVCYLVDEVFYCVLDAIFAITRTTFCVALTRCSYIPSTTFTHLRSLILVKGLSHQQSQHQSPTVTSSHYSLLPFLFHF